MPIWSKAGADVHRLIERTAKKYHDDIGNAGLTVLALFAEPEDENAAPPLKLNGYTCAAIVRKVSTRDRVAGKTDVEIHIDKGQWDDLTAEQREALIDHELEHVVILRDKDRPDLYRKDAAGRPVVFLKLHDWQIGGFRVIAERHGDNALEVIAARSVIEKHGQLLFEFASAAGAR